MRVLLFTAVLLSLAASVASRQPDTATCAAAAECRHQAVDAIGRQDFETAHTLAWRAVQMAVRNDPESLRLLARAQSLSGRPHDALVMLHRLAQLDVRVSEALTSEDYRRVRDLTGWPTVLAAIEAAPGAASGGASVTSPAPSSTPIAASPGEPPARASAPGGLAEEEVLTLPSSLNTVVALAYDAVSRRFVVADDGSDTLKIIDELSGRAMNLVSSGWAGGTRVSALSIDTRRGDLWAATPEALHRVQLVSGRPLQSIAAPATEPTVNFVALASGATAVFALDAAGARIYTTTAGDQTLRLYATLGNVAQPRGLAVAPDGSLYISHSSGIARIGAGARASVVSGPRGADLTRVHALAWTSGALLGVQDKGGALTAVKMSVAASGRRISGVKTVGPVRSTAATVAGGVFYHVAVRTDRLAIVGQRVAR